MPTTRREQCFVYFLTVLEGINDFVLCERNPDWTIEHPTEGQLPAVAMYDGSEVAEDQNVEDASIIQRVVVDIRVLKPTISSALTDLNNKLGSVQLALSQSVELNGGFATRVRYAGCDEPQVVIASDGPCEASLEVQFEIQRLDKHNNPYL